MYLVGRSPGHSLFMQWPFLSPWSIGCSVQGRKLTLLVPFVCSPGPLSSLPFCLSVTQRLPDLLQREESRLNISAIGGSFARIQSSIIVHPPLSG
ncbi:hypothetical protein KP509_23G029100 [Ceratopteris richardii]|uniref:Uncharacterized protein n=1 Tax=Ceratopteris richardii TaxID=49495 RepID=A0A8T2RYT6_CERRI|nr:hypothetical protein KP509_23G029100 [Ceratopteris richardii]